MTKAQKITAALAALVLSTGMTWTGYADDLEVSSDDYTTKANETYGNVNVLNGHTLTISEGNTLTADVIGITQSVSDPQNKINVQGTVNAKSVSLQGGSLVSTGTITSQGFALTNGSTATLSNGGNLSGTDHSAALGVEGENTTFIGTNVNFTGSSVYADDGGTINLTGGKVAVTAGSFTTEGGTIETNSTAITSGVWANSTFTQNNNAWVLDKAGTVSVTGGSLSGDDLAAQGEGSRITVKDATVNVSKITGSNAVTTSNWDESSDSWVSETMETNAGGTITFNNTKATANSVSLAKSTMNLENQSTLDVKGNTDLLDSTLTISGADSKFSTKNLNLKGNSTLSVENETNYSVTGTAKVEDGSKIEVSGENSTITFEDGSHLYADGTTPVLSVKDKATVKFAANSSVHVNAVQDSDNAYTVATIANVESDGKITVDSKASLFVVNAQTDGSTYDFSKLFNGSTTEWSGNLYGSTILDVFNKDDQTFDSNNIAERLPDAFAAEAVTAAYTGKDGAAKDFINNVLKHDTGEGDAANVAAATNALNSAAGLTGLAGVGYGMYSFTNAFNDTIREHKVGAESLWATYLHDKRTVDGLKVGNLDANYDLSYNGFVLGSDFYNNGKVQVGAAFAYATGDVSTKGGLVSTKNDVDYYGGTVYGVLDGGNGLTYKAELGYGKSSNDLTQYNSGTKITGKTDATAFHVGVSAEKEIKTGADTWTPFAGLYFIDLGIDDYTDSLGFKHDSDNASAWTLPIGVSYRHEVNSGDWTYAPVVTLGYRFAFGDKDIDETYGYNGVGDTFGTDIAESVFFGRLGFEAAKDNVSFGVHYGYEKGSDTKSNQWGVNLAYHF